MSKKMVATPTVSDDHVILVTTHRIAASFLMPGSYRQVVIKRPHSDDAPRAETRGISIRRGSPPRSIGFIPIKPEYIPIVSSRLKLMAHMDIGKKRRPQQGTIPARKEFGKSLPALSVQTRKLKGREIIRLQLCRK